MKGIVRFCLGALLALACGGIVSVSADGGTCGNARADMRRHLVRRRENRRRSS